MTIVLCVGVFSGCNTVEERIPTADELVNGAFGSNPVESLSAGLDINVNVDVNMSSVGISETMNMDCQVKADMAGNIDGSTSTKGTLNYSVLGIRGVKDIETYEIVNTDQSTKIYSYDQEADKWTMQHSTVKNGEAFIDSIVGLVNIENFENESLVLKAVQPADEVYTVLGTIKSLSVKGNIAALNRLIGSENLISNDLVFDVTMEFYKETKMLKSICLSLNTSMAEKDAQASYSVLNMKIDIHKINTVEIRVPQYVFDSIDSNGSVTTNGEESPVSE